MGHCFEDPEFLRELPILVKEVILSPKGHHTPNIRIPKQKEDSLRIPLPIKNTLKLRSNKLNIIPKNQPLSFISDSPDAHGLVRADRIELRDELVLLGSAMRVDRVDLLVVL